MTYEVRVYPSAAAFHAGLPENAVVGLGSKERAARVAAYALVGLKEYRRAHGRVVQIRSADGAWSEVMALHSSGQG